MPRKARLLLKKKNLGRWRGGVQAAARGKGVMEGNRNSKTSRSKPNTDEVEL